MTTPFAVITLAPTAFLAPGFCVVEFLSAMLDSIIVSLTGMLASWSIGAQGAVDVLSVGRSEPQR